MTYELNMDNSVRTSDGRITENSKIVEVFSALVRGEDAGVAPAVKDKCVKELSEIAARAAEGNSAAVGEMNAVVKFAIQPHLIRAVQLFNFMGTYRQIGYDEVPMMTTYSWESIDPRFQAPSGDVTFPAVNWRRYPIGTQNISAGFAIDYREVQNGNFAGTVAEGMQQVQTAMQNKAVYYVISVLYDAIKNAKGIKHFAENAGITQASLDKMLAAMRRYGRVNIAGDYSVVSQLNDFVGYKTVGDATISFGSAAVADEIRRTGLISFYKGAYITELPNAIDYSKLNKAGDDYGLYMPEGLLFLIPQGTVSPLQVFLRGGLTTMTGDDIVTRTHLTRFDMEFGAGVAEGMEDQIGLIHDTNFDAPAV